MNEPVTARLHQDFARLECHHTVREALAWLRQHPPGARVLYLYVLDKDGRLWCRRAG
jgi:Mg/Co/Ni transporter MgtE